MAGCTISPLAFTMAMEVIIRASKWVVGGKRLASGMRLPPIRAYMDDITTVTTTVACTNRLLGKLTNNIEWAQMQFKPTKSRSISIIKGKVVDKTFFINGEAIPTVSEKPVKSLGRWYDRDLKDTVHSCALPDKLKLWCFQCGLLMRLLWPLTVYEVSLTTVEKLEALISSYIRKWLGVPRCLSRVGLYGKGILQLPVSALTEEFKGAWVRLEMTLVESRDKCVREAAPVLKTGRKWAAKKAVEDAKAALRIGDIMGQVQHGRGGLGLSSAPPTWHKAAPAQRRKLVVNEVQKQEERMSLKLALGLAHQATGFQVHSGVPESIANISVANRGSHRKFINECPSGLITLHEFQRHFCDGTVGNESSEYAEQIFRTLDNNGDGIVDFREYVTAISMLIQGSPEEKLRWSFKLYDKDSDGAITRSEMLEIMQAVYKMSLAASLTKTNPLTVEECTNKIFSRLDKDRNAVISLEEFIEGALDNDWIREMLECDPNTVKVEIPQKTSPV
ncbi:GCIP protein, partial [Polyodon spathula]|nr:GCIP protein [Polyodon spathula]